MGIDPTTHKPKNHALGCSQPKDIANLSHMAQWESARLEAEARIVRESKLVSNSYHSQLIMNKDTVATAPPPPPPRPPCLDILKVWQGTWIRPRKDITTTTRFFASNGSLESPTSILNFSDNMITNIPINVGLIQENAFVTDINYVGNPGACTIGKASDNYEDEQVKGIMENSIQLHDITDPNSSTYAADSLRFPSFLEGFTDLPPSTIACAAASGPADNVVFEDNKINYWSNILNVVNSPLGSPVF